jgi:hypothetical protein
MTEIKRVIVRRCPARKYPSRWKVLRLIPPDLIVVSRPRDRLGYAISAGTLWDVLAFERGQRAVRIRDLVAQAAAPKENDS